MPLTEHGSKGSGNKVCTAMSAKPISIALPETFYLLLKMRQLQSLNAPPSTSSVLLYILYNELPASDLHAKPCKIFCQICCMFKWCHKWCHFLPILFCQTLWKKQILCGKYFHSLEEQRMGCGFYGKSSFLCPDQPACTVINHNYYSKLNKIIQGWISLSVKIHPNLS